MKFLALLGLAFASTAFAAQRPSFKANLAQENCKGGQCVLFEVHIQMNAYQSNAKTVEKKHYITYGENVNDNYTTTVVRSGYGCKKSVVVPYELYYTITETFESMISRNGEPVPALTPAQQTTVLLYTTMMQQTLNFKCDAIDLSTEN